MWLGQRLYIVTATLVQSDFGYASIKQKRAPIVLTGRALDASFLEIFSQRFLLNKIHLHSEDTRSDPTQAHAPIYNAKGEHIATMDWSPKTPGAELLNRSWHWVLAFIACLFVLIFALYRLNHRQTAKARAAEERTNFLAYHDFLTTLPNRIQLEQEITGRLKDNSKQVLALHCVNLARFKDVNDTHGISVGDELLKAMALRLANSCGGSARVFRLGGDAFAVLKSIASPSQAGGMGEWLLDVLSLPFSLSVGDKRISAFVGVAFSGAEAASASEILRRANLALFRAKAAGESVHLTFDARMDEELRNKTQHKNDLRTALNQDALHMVYRPQVRLNGEIVGVEALMRWTHKDLGPISPVIFIPLTEEAGLIKEIGDFALHRAA